MEKITRHETVFGVDVIYFDGEVDFIQKINLKGTAKAHNFTRVSGIYGLQ